MAALRSLLFYILFFGWTALIVSEYQKYVASAARYWLVMEAHKTDARYNSPAPSVAAKPGG